MLNMTGPFYPLTRCQGQLRATQLWPADAGYGDREDQDLSGAEAADQTFWSKLYAVVE